MRYLEARRHGGLLCGLFWLGQLSGLLAHPNLQNAMWAQFESSRVRLAVNVSLKELSVAQGVELTEQAVPAMDGPPAKQWADAARRHAAYVLDHLRLEAGGRSLPGRVDGVTPPSAIGDPETTVYQYELEFPFDGPVPAEVTFLHTMLSERPYSEGVPWNIGYILRTKNERSLETRSWLLSAGLPSVIETAWAEPQPAGVVGDRVAGAGRENWWWGAASVALGGVVGAVWIRRKARRK